MNTTQTQGLRGRVGGTLLRVPSYLLLAGNLIRDNRLSQAQKAAAVACLGYALSPIDLVPGFIPIAGQLDDLAVLIGGLRTLLRTLPPSVAEEHLSRTGLTLAVMGEDLRTVRDAAWWLARKGAALVGRLTRDAIDGAILRVREALRPAGQVRNPMAGERRQPPQ
jgi:uncharacterized membrane protein YkvA (DUF1232 family)